METLSYEYKRHNGVAGKKEFGTFVIPTAYSVRYRFGNPIGIIHISLPG